MKRSRTSFDEELFEESPVSSDKTLSDLASRVLFSDSLDEKLRLTDVRQLSDCRRPKQSRYASVTPGRPEHLAFAGESETRPTFPRSPSMIEEKSRGILLHFFANHELLAAELMSLALLKFPDAPDAFRRGLADTLREEQMHTRWYVNRMKQCGIEFGEYPLNRFFWDAVSTMDSPVDYVSRLSLTFEQANLDYAKHYAQLLKEAGDDVSAAILNRIYRDEISHVGYGLHWFRQWKDPGESDWSALRKRLIFPLSPSRAKGNRTPFNADGRSKAGLDDDYIHQLSLFERSNGRTPNVFYFNPDAENRIAAFPSVYHPNARVKAIIEDLEVLTAFLARRDDVVLMRKPLSLAHRAKLAEAGFQLPEIEPLTADNTLPDSSLLRKRKINELRPWALSPEIDFVFSPLTEERELWKPHYRELFSKASQIEALQEWMGPSFLIRSGDDLVRAAEELQREGWSEGIIKRPFSTAGGGMRRLALKEATAFSGSDMSDSVFKEGGLLLEPAHQRVFDFSVQYTVDVDEIRLVGFVEQIIADSGGYRGSVSFLKFCSGLSPDLARFVMAEAVPLYDGQSDFVKAIHRWSKEHNYRGPLGVDAYVYETLSGAYALRPACEINARYTMGRVAHDLRRQIAPGRGLKLEIVKADDLPPEAENPEFSNGRLAGGSMILNELDANTRFAARISVAKQQSTL